jgi:hypothetical protein
MNVECLSGVSWELKNSHPTVKTSRDERSENPKTQSVVKPFSASPLTTDVNGIAGRVREYLENIL